MTDSKILIFSVVYLILKQWSLVLGIGHNYTAHKYDNIVNRFSGCGFK